MSKVVIDITKMNADEKLELGLLKSLENAERNLAEALVAMDAMQKGTRAYMTKRALKSRHKIEILKAQIHGVRENNLEFRSVIRKALDKQLLKELKGRAA